MRQKIALGGSVLSLVFAAGVAANPVVNVVNGLGLGSIGGIASGSAASLAMPAAPLLRMSSPAAASAARLTSAAPLPGLGGAKAEGPLGVTVLQEGADGSGYGDVVQLAGFGVIQDELDGVLVTPLLGLDGDGGFVDVAAFDGNGTANAGTGTDGLLGAALFSGSDTGNGGVLALGVVNDDRTGNDGLIGIAALSGTDSGTGDVIGVGVLNTQDPLHVCIAGMCGGLETVTDGAGAAPSFGAMGIALGGGPDSQVDESNPLLNAGVLSGRDSGDGGLIGVGVIAGDDSADADLAGVCVLCGDGSANGTLGVAVLSGKNSGFSSNDTTLGGLAGVAVLSEQNSGNSDFIGAGVLNGAGSGNGGLIGAGVLNGEGSGNGGLIGAGVINSGGTNDGSAALQTGGPGGDNSSGNGTLGIGALNSGFAGGTPPANPPAGQTDTSGTPNVTEDEDLSKQTQQCLVASKDAKRRVQHTRQRCDNAKTVAARN